MKKRKQKAKPIKELLRIDLREKYRDTYFNNWEGRDLSAHHRFVDMDREGIVRMVFALPLPHKNRADLVIESCDGGETWEEYYGPKIYPPQSLGIFSRGKYQLALRGAEEFWRSFDGGYTWSAAHRVTTADDLMVDGLGLPNAFSAIMISSGTYAGRIVIVADHFLGQEGPDGQLIGSLYTDDWGESWHSSRLFFPHDPLPFGPEGFGEPAVVEMPSGWLWMVMRSLYGELWQCVSRNGGASWNNPTPTGLASPIANCYAVREPWTGAIVLSWNLTKPGTSQSFRDRGSLYRPRTNLVFSVSHDNCRTWTVPVTVEEQGRFYPTIHFAGDRMFIMYQSSPDEEANPWHKYGLTLVAYNRKEVLTMPAWTMETIQPFIDAGLVAHWRALACQPKTTETVD